MSDTININNINLTSEQMLFVDKVKEGNNVLVDACIGSGKTTAIQALCNILPSSLKILYLTYNKLLKIDAKSKIKNKNVLVTNYHGFAFMGLIRMGKSCGISDLIQEFIKNKPKINHYDVLVLDEYQDIDTELSLMLQIIKESNPNMQIVAVGDMEQKIYDKTNLNVRKFIDEFLGEHINLEFTKCFRLNAEHAAMLGRVWNKKIIGVNNDCVVKRMKTKDVKALLSEVDPKDVLCLGSRTGGMNNLLNSLETDYPEKYNKKTVYASINQISQGNTEPTPTSAIFTTYDSSKGLERKYCILYDFVESYWDARVHKPGQSYEILRNIFLVAASRGKGEIIFVREDEPILTEMSLSEVPHESLAFNDVSMSDMFSFKYKEDIEDCYNLLNVEKINIVNQSEVLNIKERDELIDLAPCISIYQQAVYFNHYDINKEIELWFKLNKDLGYLYNKVQNLNLEEKILFLVSLITKQYRYRNQVETPFVKDEEKEEIIKRLSCLFTPDESIQNSCSIEFYNKQKGGKLLFTALGNADVIKDNIVYNLLYVNELCHEDFLTTACYMYALKKDVGRIWNIRNNEMYEIKIPNIDKFMDKVVNCITKGAIERYYGTR